LYGQVSELLRRRRERRAQADAGQAGMTRSAVEIPSAGQAEQVLAGRMVAGPVDEQVLDRHAEQLAKLKGLLAPYADGDITIQPDDRQLLAQVEAARSLLEQIYRQHITFRGEQRPATGTPIEVQTGEVGQYATQVIASGERAAAVGRDAGTVITGNVGDPNSITRPPLPE
jgi:hypothetical protein